MKTLKKYDGPWIERKTVNGVRLTVRQTLQFDYFMEHSENFRNRFFELSAQTLTES